MEKNIEKINSKKDTWWYRSLKVLFILVCVGAIAFSITAALEKRPITTEQVNANSSYIQCSSDIGTRKVYHFADYNLLLSYDDNLNYSSRETAKSICGNSLFAYHVYVIREEVTVGSWEKMFGLLWLSLASYSIILYLISSTMKYIILGENFKNPFNFFLK